YDDNSVACQVGNSAMKSARLKLVRLSHTRSVQFALTPPSLCCWHKQARPEDLDCLSGAGIWSAVVFLPRSVFVLQARFSFASSPLSKAAIVWRTMWWRRHASKGP